MSAKTEDKHDDKEFSYIGGLSLLGFIALGFFNVLPAGFQEAFAPLTSSGSIFYGLLAAIWVYGYFTVHGYKCKTQVIHTVVGAILFTLGILPFVPLSFSDHWGTRTDSVSKIGTFLCASGLISTGVHFMTVYSSHTAQWSGIPGKMFGYSLMAISLFFALPQSTRNSFYKWYN
jgi:hypothetical protein